MNPLSFSHSITDVDKQIEKKELLNWWPFDLITEVKETTELLLVSLSWLHIPVLQVTNQILTQEKEKRWCRKTCSSIWATCFSGNVMSACDSQDQLSLCLRKSDWDQLLHLQILVNPITMFEEKESRTGDERRYKKQKRGKQSLSLYFFKHDLCPRKLQRQTSHFLSLSI